MLIFPSMLVEAANQAGMKVPPDPDNFDPKEYKHFNLFCELQLGRPVRWGNHWTNAGVVMAVPAKSIDATTCGKMLANGYNP